MIKNRILMQLASIIIIIFGGIFTIRYFKTGEVLIEQLLAASVGVILLITSLLWRIRHKRRLEKQLSKQKPSL